MLHDRYDLDIEHACRLLPFDSRDNDEKGAGMFWDLAGTIAAEINTFSQDEKQELIYNALHKVREATLAEVTPKMLQGMIYRYVAEHFGTSEADDPSWSIEPLAKYIHEQIQPK